MSTREVGRAKGPRLTVNINSSQQKFPETAFFSIVAEPANLLETMQTSIQPPDYVEINCQSSPGVSPVGLLMLA